MERGLLIQVFKSPQEINLDFGIWENQEYWALESGIQLEKSGIALTSSDSTDKNWNPVPGIRNPLRRIQNPLHGTILKGSAQNWPKLICISD